MGDRSLEGLVDGEMATRLGDDVDGGQVEQIGIGLAADGVEERFGDQALAGFQVGDGGERGGVESFDADDFFAEAEGDAGAAELVHERLGDFAVDVGEERVLDLDDGYFTAKGGGHGGVLHADDAPADNDEGLGEFTIGDFDELVGVVDLEGGEGDVFTAGGAGAAGDENIGRGELALGVGTGDVEDVGVGSEGGVAVDELDAVALELVFDDGVLAFDDLVDAEHEVLDIDAGFEAVAAAVKAALAEAAQVEHGFAEGFRRNGAGVEANTPEVGRFVDDSDAMAQFGGFDGTVMAGGPAANYQEVVVIRRRSFSAHFDLIVPQLGGMAMIR